MYDTCAGKIPVFTSCSFTLPVLSCKCILSTLSCTDILHVLTCIIILPVQVKYLYSPVSYLYWWESWGCPCRRRSACWPQTEPAGPDQSHRSLPPWDGGWFGSVATLSLACSPQRNSNSNWNTKPMKPNLNQSWMDAYIIITPDIYRHLQLHQYINNKNKNNISTSACFFRHV